MYSSEAECAAMFEQSLNDASPATVIYAQQSASAENATISN